MKPRLAVCVVAPLLVFPAAIRAQSDRPAVLSMWNRIEVVQSYASIRFRYVDTARGQVTDRDYQFNQLLRLKLNLAADGRTYIQGRAETGDNFQSDHDPIGTGRFRTYIGFNLKTLFLGQRIGSKAEAAVGSMDFDMGAGSQATYADNDGWISGYRLRFSGLRTPWLPDGFSLTAGHVGDFKKPNVFSRLHRLNQFNYVQALVRKQLTENTASSFEFDHLEDIPYFRGAVSHQGVPLPVIRDVSAEFITRAAKGSAFGWSATAGRSLDQGGRWRLITSYSDMPRVMFDDAGRQILLTGDPFMLGRRLGMTLRFAPIRSLELVSFASHRFDSTPGHRNRAQIMVRYHLTKPLNTLLGRG
jgi:hypothetical protein